MRKIIIFGKNLYQYNGFDINQYVYRDAIMREDVLYVEPKESVWSRYLSFFYSNEYGIAFRKKLFIPFRKAAFNSFLKNPRRIKKKDSNVFVFFCTEPWFFDQNGFLDYLRKQYHNAKLVYHITNTVQNIQFGPEYLRRFFDLVSTCNKGDSSTYGLPFFPNACSYIPFGDNKEPQSDCLFVGHAKNRLNDLITVFEILSGKGINCEFFISGVPEKDMRHGDRIRYNQALDYDVILRKTEKTNVVLEFLQEGMDSHTLRFPEAVAYGKKLITNNAAVLLEKSYSEQNIRLIRTPEDVADIDYSFFKTPLTEPYPNKDSVSSRHFLTFIYKNLGK